MKIILAIKRFNPEKDKEPFYQNFEIKAEPTDRLLDALMYIKSFIDPSLGLRRSCAHGVCGSDAMIVNGKERLACKTLIKELVESDGTKIKIEPLRTLTVQKDLMVDQYKFFQHYKQAKPFLINEEKIKEKERLQSIEEKEKIDDPTKCILCASCYSACPVIQGKNPRYMGPAAIIQAARFNDDSRDKGFKERLSALDYPDGIWPCVNYLKCTEVCPRQIKVTELINQTKLKIIKFRRSRGEKINNKPCEGENIS